MNRMDIDAFAANANEIIGGLPSHRTRGPVCMTRAGVPEAVVIPADATSLDVIVRAANKHWHETHRKDDRP